MAAFKLNIYKAFRRRPEHRLNILGTFNLRLVSKASVSFTIVIVPFDRAIVNRVALRNNRKCYLDFKDYFVSIRGNWQCICSWYISETLRNLAPKT